VLPVTVLQLIHNVLAGPIPSALARYRTTPVAQCGLTSCGRCGVDVFEHLWILRNPAVTEQGGVIDCERRARG
jgi:hypothetical protein